MFGRTCWDGPTVPRVPSDVVASGRELGPEELQELMGLGVERWWRWNCHKPSTSPSSSRMMRQVCHWAMDFATFLSTISTYQYISVPSIIYPNLIMPQSENPNIMGFQDPIMVIMVALNCSCGSWQFNTQAHFHRQWSFSRVSYLHRYGLQHTSPNHQSEIIWTLCASGTIPLKQVIFCRYVK